MPRAFLSALLLLAIVGCASPLEKARSARSEHDYERAQQLYEHAMEDPKSARPARDELASMYAEQASEAKNAARAERTYHRALELDPVHGQALTGLVRLLRDGDRLEDARAVLDSANANGDCGACNRLVVVVLLEQGERAFAKEDWDVAIGRYAAALKLRPQPGSAIAIASAQLAARRYPDAVAALEVAAPLIANADKMETEQFNKTRRFLVEKAIENRQFDLADRARQIEVANEPVTELVGLALAVGDGLLANNDEAGASARYEALLATDLDEAETKRVRDRLATIHANRATAHLHSGNATKADEQLKKAIALRPDDWVLKLQRILAISEKTGAVPALEGLSRVPKDTVGVAKTRAILLSQHVRELIAGGDLATANAKLVEARKASPDLPEVQLASAYVLANSSVESLDRRETKALLGRGSLVSYPGRVLRYAEALAELDRVDTETLARKKNSLFAAPWLVGAAKQLRRELETVYPFGVGFRSDPEPVVVLRNRSSVVLEVSLQGPGDFSDKVGVGATGDREITLPDSGLVKIQVVGNAGLRKKSVFLAEPYAEVVIPVG